MKDRDSKLRRAFMVPNKGVQSYAVKNVTHEIAKMHGYATLCFKSDQEPATMALKSAVKKKAEGLGVDIQMEESRWMAPSTGMSV